MQHHKAIGDVGSRLGEVVILRPELSMARLYELSKPSGKLGEVHTAAIRASDGHRTQQPLRASQRKHAWQHP